MFDIRRDFAAFPEDLECDNPESFADGLEWHSRFSIGVDANVTGRAPSSWQTCLANKTSGAATRSSYRPATSNSGVLRLPGQRNGGVSSMQNHVGVVVDGSHSRQIGEVARNLVGGVSDTA